MNKKIEVWHLVPGVPGTEASSCGRIKMKDVIVHGENGKEKVVYGGIRPQYSDKDGYMQVNIFYDSKWHNKKVHRLVAEAFLPNPDNLPQVNHKDCNRANNYVENLEWCDASYNNSYREKYGKSLGHLVTAYDLNTFKKLQFHSQHEACRELGVTQSAINHVLRGRINQVGGYYFTEDERKVAREKLLAIKANMQCRDDIIAINLKSQEVLRFKTRVEAGRQLGFSDASVRDVLAGRINQTHGYWFVCIDDNATKKTKAKFSDAVADKVAKLMEMI